MASEDAAPRSKAPDRRWQSADLGPAGIDRGSRRRTRLLLLTALLLALVSAVVVWVLFIRFQSASVYFLGIGIGEYNARSLPVNPFVNDDINRLVQRFPKGMHDHPVTNSEKLLRNELKELKDGPLKNRPDTHLILYFSALALVRDGKVYVLPADAEPDKPAHWLDIQSVFDALKECPARRKLLILDLAHGLADPRWGVLSDRVAETLEADLEKNPPPFPVICSCSAGQTSLASDDLPGAAFGYYLDQALRGRAGVNDTQSIKVNEVFDYVKTQVSRWAIVNRGLRQEPRLFGDPTADFAIPYEREPEAEPVDKKLAPYPEALKDGWKQRDRLRDEGAMQRAPRFSLRLDAGLQRQEDRWRSGAPTAKDEGDLKALLDDFPRAMAMKHVPRRSLPLAGAKEDPDLPGSVARLLDMDRKDNAKAAEELVKLLAAADSKKADFAQQAWAVVQALCQMPQIGPDHLAIADAALTKLLDGLKVKPSFVEVLAVHRLAQFAKERDPAPDSKYLQALLLTMRSHQAVIAALDRGPEPLPWIKAAVDEADQKRRNAQKNLLGNQPRATWPGALEDLQSARTTYDELAKRAVDALQSARLELDRAFALLPAYGRLLCDGPEEDAHHQEAWEKAAEEAAILQSFFVAVPTGASDPAAVFTMETPARKLKGYLDELQAMLAKRVERAAKDDTGKGQQRLRCLLASPLLSAGDRISLLEKQMKLAAKLFDEMNAEAPPEKGVFPERIVAALRARMALALLHLAGADADKKIVDLAKKTQVGPADLAALERNLRDLCGPAYPDPLREGIAGPVADRLNRLRSPWDQERRAEMLDRDPTRKLQLDQRKDFATWLKTSYQAELRSLQPAPLDADSRDFYVRAADEVRP